MSAKEKSNLKIERYPTVNSFTGLYSVRSVEIELSGSGITKYYSESDGNPFNVYGVTRYALERIEAEHGELALFER